MPTEHRITTDDGAFRSYWECDCGARLKSDAQ